MTLDLLPYEMRCHFTDPQVTDVLVHNDIEMWIERKGVLQRCPDLRPGDITRALHHILSPLGRRLDRLSPIVDARLADGTRVCAVIEPIAVGGTCAAFRIFRQSTFSLADFAPSQPDSRWPIVHERLLSSTDNILVTGATGSGKSSLVSTLASTSRRDDRVIVIEDTLELVIDHPHVIRLETRDPTVEGRGAVGLDDLARTALRLRPDRLIIGEVRGSEALTLVDAMSTGHRGCLATLHAHSALEGLRRLDVLTMQAARGWQLDDVRSLVNSAIGLVVHVQRNVHGRRTITEIASIDSGSGHRRLDYHLEPC